MRSTCVCSRYALGVMAVALFGLSVSVYGEQFDLRPRSSNGAFTIIGTDLIEIPAGGVEVTLEIVAFGYSAAPPVGNPPAPPRLGAFQASIDGTNGYQGANAIPSNPGVDLTPKGGVNTNDGTGAFQVLKACNVTLLDCTVGGPPVCTGVGNFCLDNPRFILAPCSPLAAVATVTLDFEYGAAAQTANCGATDPGAAGADTTGYCGTLVVNVPGTAKGTYTIDFVQDVNKTFMNDEYAGFIPGMFTVPGKIKVVTGRCCSRIGQVTPPDCEDNLTQADCNSRPSGRNWEKDGLCPPVGADCPSCQNDGQCNDPIGAVADNACTSDACQPDNTCLFTPLYNAQTHCCDPTNGSTTLIDDNDPCTADACDPLTGTVSHTPTTGNACDDTFDCTVNDVCDAGACAGTDVNTIPCQDDADCPLGTCGTAVAGFCECSENTPLCLDVKGKYCSISQAECQSDADCGSSGGVCVRLYDDPNCFDGGETMTVAIHIGAGSQQVTGGQFLINYDPSCLDFVSIGPCAGDAIFTNVIQVDVDEVAGEIFYAVTNDPATAANESSPGPYDMGCIVYTKTDDCDACNVCFGGYNPKWTILTNDSGNRVPLDNCGCSKDVRKAGDITLNTPPGASVNADCGKTYANVTWATPSASDTCEGPLAVACQGQSVQGFPVGGLINNGGNFAQGKTFFTCTAENTCGKSVTNVWTVVVSDQHTLDVEVHLQPTMNNTGTFSRAIIFDLYADCASDPTEVCQVVDFQGPWNFPGHGVATLKVDKGNYQCITAQDCLHTLRAAADIECVNNRWTAIFKGDPLQGGNWLVGGNLDCWKGDATWGDKNTINILDFGMFMAQLAAGAQYPNGNTDCQTAGPHGDINADGAVDNLDYAFIVNNFLDNSKGLCCPDPTAGAQQPNPITSITVKELRRSGYGELAVGDLNKDGVLNLEDMAMYMQGVLPEQVAPIRVHKGRGTR